MDRDEKDKIEKGMEELEKEIERITEEKGNEMRDLVLKMREVVSKHIPREEDKKMRELELKCMSLRVEIMAVTSASHYPETLLKGWRHCCILQEEIKQTGFSYEEINSSAQEVKAFKEEITLGLSVFA